MVSFSSAKRDHREGPGVDETGRPRPAPLGATVPFPGRSGRDRSPSDLARMIESEIIPRLMLAHRQTSAVGPSPTPTPVSSGTLAAFVHMSLTGDAARLVDFIDALMAGGLPLEGVFTELLIPAAHRLGDDWNVDAVSFTDVTLGLARLQQVVRTLSWKIPGREPDDQARAIYLIPCPGDQHAFGLVVLEDGFRRAGWRTRLDAAVTGREAVDGVRHEWFDVFGLSATSDTPVEVIAGTVAAVRAASCNADIFVMVGGRVFVEQPELAREVGADATAPTAPAALLLADNAVRRAALG